MSPRRQAFTLVEVMVVVTEIDRQGRVNLSRKAAMQRHLAKETVGSGTE